MRSQNDNQYQKTSRNVHESQNFRSMKNLKNSTSSYKNFCILEMIFDIFNIFKCSKTIKIETHSQDTFAKTQKSIYVFLWVFQSCKSSTKAHSVKIVTNNFLNIVVVSNSVISIMTTFHSSSSSIKSSFTQICL